ncbi:MAG: hypothetical protein IB618_02775 [Candidatus Pacearchaeota archaeon]|nr:MAG: hypothetical protein IB618_02775 [Candidatus Pacearchaeota archaeon]
MARKRIMKIPKTVTIKCPFCGKGNRIYVSSEKGIYSIECKKCKKKVETPQAKCCLVCAFSNRRCPSSLIREAKSRNLEIRY